MSIRRSLDHLSSSSVFRAAILALGLSACDADDKNEPDVGATGVIVDTTFHPEHTGTSAQETTGKSASSRGETSDSDASGSGATSDMPSSSDASDSSNATTTGTTDTNGSTTSDTRDLDPAMNPQINIIDDEPYMTGQSVPVYSNSIILEGDCNSLTEEMEVYIDDKMIISNEVYTCETEGGFFVQASPIDYDGKSHEVCLIALNKYKVSEQKAAGSCATVTNVVPN